MKKFAASCLLIIYFTFSAGATVHLHYCMGALAGFSFSDTNEGSCSECGMDQHDDANSCCKDVEVTAKISDNHNTAYTNCYLTSPWHDIAVDFPQFEFTPVPAKPYFGIFEQYPPGYTIDSLFIRYRNLRI